MEDAFETAAPEVNFLVLLLWVAMAALLIVLIAMGGARAGAESACAIRARITIAGNRMPGVPDSAGARIHDV